MKSQFRVQLPDAFAVTEQQLRKVHDLLEERIGPVEIDVTCADSANRKFSNVAELLAFENPPAKKILDVNLQSRSEDRQKETSIRFSGTGWEPGIRIQINAEDDIAERLHLRLHEILGATRRWYYRCRRFSMGTAMCVIYLMSWLSVVVYVAVNSPPGTELAESTARGSATAILILVVYCSLLFGAGCVLSRARDKYFPHAVFLIGQEKETDVIAEKFRWGVVIAFVVSLVASLVAPLVSR